MCHNKERLLYTEAACMLVSFVNTFLVGFSVLLAVKILIQDGGGDFPEASADIGPVIHFHLPTVLSLVQAMCHK